MKILSSDLINLPVFTQSGRHLGRVDSFEVDLDSQAITKYHVKTGLIRGLWHQQLLIDPSQVISISKEKMIVEDNVVKEKRTQLAGVKLVTPVTK